MSAVSSSQRVVLVAGEASGDLHGAKLAVALKRLLPSLELTGIGGVQMRQAGVRLVFDARELSVMGLVEVLSRQKAIRQGFQAVSRLLDKKTDLVILIDFPDFNLCVARAAKKRAIPVLYYISPKIWAWRTGRVRKIRRLVDRMAVILPFETAFYRSHQVPVTFVGHPLLDDPVYQNPKRFQRADKKTTTIGLLPGSRHMEIRRLLPVLLETAARIHRRRPQIRFVLSLHSQLNTAACRLMLTDYKNRLPLSISSQNVAHLFAGSDLLIAASGTVTLEAAICAKPMIVVYQVSPLTYMTGKQLIKVPFISLVNLIAGKKVVPELIQHDANPVTISRQALSLIESPQRLDQMRTDLLNVRARLGRPGAAQQTAQLARALLTDGDGASH